MSIYIVTYRSSHGGGLHVREMAILADNGNEAKGKVENYITNHKNPKVLSVRKHISKKGK